MSSNLFSNLYIQTRGKTIDYRFLLQAPQEPWWTSYEKDTSFEYPTLIIERESRGGRGRFCLSGVSSSTRRDRVGRIIRYTLVAEFQGSEERLLHLAKMFLDELSEQGSTPTLSEIFDNCFPREYVERVLVPDNIDIDSEDKELTERFDLLLSEVQEKSNQGSSGVPPETSIWWGGLKNDESRSRWMSLAESILQQGESGKALLLNLASGQSLRDLATNVKNMALLLPESSEAPQPFRPDVGKKNWWILVISLLTLLTIFVLIFNIFNNPSIESFEVLPSKNPQTGSVNKELSISTLISSREELKTIHLSAHLSDSNQNVLNEPLPLEQCSKKEKLECRFPVSLPKDKIEPGGVYVFQLTVEDIKGKVGRFQQEYPFEVSE